MVGEVGVSAGGELIRLADERGDSVNRQDGITFVTSADSWLPLPLCVSSNYTGRYRSGRQRGVVKGSCGGDESSSKTRTRTKPGKTERGGQALKRQAMTDSLSPFFYSAARSFLGFVLSALPFPTHPPKRPPLWKALRMICVQGPFHSSQRGV